MAPHTHSLMCKPDSLHMVGGRGVLDTRPATMPKRKGDMQYRKHVHCAGPNNVFLSHKLFGNLFLTGTARLGGRKITVGGRQ